MRFTLLITLFFVSAAAFNEAQAQSCCKPSSCATNPLCKIMGLTDANSTAATAEKNTTVAATTAPKAQFVSNITPAAAPNAKTSAKSCEPQNCAPKNCDPSKCDPSKKCTPCPPSQCNKAAKTTQI